MLRAHPFIARLLLLASAALLAFVPVGCATAAATVGFACQVSRVPASNTSIHGNFGYVRVHVQATAACNGPVIVTVEFLTLGATIASFDKAWLYSEADIAPLHVSLTNASMNGKRLRFNHGTSVLGGGLCGTTCRQGFHVEFGV